MQKKLIFLFAILVFLLASCVGKSELFRNNIPSDFKPNNLTLWYNFPATDWMTEALPVGNGKVGAMIFGGIEKERLTLNEKTLWDGGPGEIKNYNGGNIEGDSKIPEIRAEIEKGNYANARNLGNKHLTGKGIGFGAYVVLSDLYLEFENHSAKDVTSYVRYLDIENSLHGVCYDLGGYRYKRETFVSYPNNLLAMNLTTTADALPSFAINFDHPKSNLSYRDVFGLSSSDAEPYRTGRTIVQKAKANNFASGGFECEIDISAMLNSNSMEYGIKLKAFAKTGMAKVGVVNRQEILTIEGANNISIYLASATDYLPLYPKYKGFNYKAENNKNISAVNSTSYEKVKSAHIKDYKNLFSRVDLKIDNGAIKNIFAPTDLALKAFRATKDAGVIELVYQYGRYLLISSSRDGSLPANLQGMWNDITNPPWSCDYHTNINLQLVYQPAEATNLSECHTPLLNYIPTLVEPGKKTARTYYGTRGWVVHTMNNPFGFTAPGWDVGWGHFPAGAAWLCSHLYSHYLYTLDKNFLATKAYPVMKEAALFWVDWLVPYTEGEKEYLVSSPSFSPEHGPFTRGAVMDHQIAKEILTTTAEAARILGIDSAAAKQFSEVAAKIYPNKIGRWGQLQEWMDDIDDPTDKHRHVSHLYALHPSNQISVVQTPELAQAAKKSLLARGDAGTGWAIAWKISFWARLQDGDHCFNLMQNLLQWTKEKNIKMSFPGGLYSNLLDAHPPFQIDGNMGFTSGVTELLLQSHADVVHLLPALPSSWKNGKVSGLKARGNFTVDIEWENNRLKSATIVSNVGGLLKLKYGDKTISRNMSAGEKYIFRG